jgi:hypothetical protein
MEGRHRLGGLFAHAPCRRASSLIQSASYVRSAKARIGQRHHPAMAYGVAANALNLLSLSAVLVDMAGLAAGSTGREW